MIQLQPLQLAITAVYFGLLISYLTVSAGEKNKQRLIQKMVLCGLYLVFAVLNCILFEGNVLYCVMVFCALILACAGDYLLALGSKKAFAIGSALFLATNAVLAALQIICIVSLQLTFAEIWWCLIPFAVFFCTFLFADIKEILHFGRLKKIISIYIVIVTLSGSLGIALIASGNTSGIFLGIGTFLFMVSDYCLGIARFTASRPPLAQILNSATYFTGIFLIALSLTGAIL